MVTKVERYGLRVDSWSKSSVIGNSPTNVDSILKKLILY